MDRSLAVPRAARAIRFAPYAVAAVLIATVIPFAAVPLPASLSPLITLLLGTAPVANLASCALLFSLYFVAPRRSIVILGAVFGLSSLVGLGRFLLLPLSELGEAPFHLGPNALAWMLIAYHIEVSCGTIVYASMRRSPTDACRPARSLQILVATVFAAVVVVTLLVIPIVAQSLPHLVVRGDISAIRSSGIGWVVLAFMIGALVAVTLIERDSLDVALSFAVMAMCVEIVMLIVAGHRYTAGWFFAQFGTFWAAMFFPIGVAWQLLAANRRVGALQLTVSEHEVRAREYAGRLAALWRISSNSAMSVPDKLDAILLEGGRSFRLDVEFEGYLCRLHGDRLESVAIYPDGGVTQAREPFSLAEPLFVAQLRDGVTRMWSDVMLAPELSELAGVRDRGWRSMIATMFSVAGLSYVIVFASSKTSEKPFDEDDSAFADVLATLVSTQLHQQWQLERMVFQAEHDVLTGLRNRSTFRSNVVRAIAAGSGAVMIGDVGGLAGITRSLGVLASDAVLVEVGAAFEAALQEGDMVARIGDAQFGILMPSIEPADLPRRVESYVRALDRPFMLGDRTAEASVDIGVCFGIALFPGDGNDAESIMTHATAAYDDARGLGRRAVVYFDPSLERDYQARRTALAEMRHAIAARRFTAHYQPIIDLTSHRIVGAESLVRWLHPTRGLLAPGAFLPLAIDAGLIVEIDALVARTAISDTVALSGGDPAFRNYINLVADRMMESDIVESLLALLREFHVPHASFGVEITETTAMRDVVESRSILQRFRDEGIFVALDDFGTGFSSLAYIKTFPIDVLKIDRSFIDGLPDDRDDRALVESIAAIAESFGITLHAEGVNNERQWTWLRDRGCKTLQGFAYGTPMSRDDYIAWRNARTVPAA